MQNKDRIKELLGSGLSNSAVATAVGCDISYLTQLMADPAFAEEVIVLRSKNLQANTQRDRSIDAIEDKLIEKLADAVDSNLIYKPNDILRCFAVTNAAKRRGVPATGDLNLTQPVVQLNIPQQVINNFVVNVHNEVIEAEGQTLVTMPAAELVRNLTSIKEGDEGSNDKYRKIANYLPGAISGGIVEAGSRK